MYKKKLIYSIAAATALSAMVLTGCKEKKTEAEVLSSVPEKPSVPLKLKKISPETKAYLEGKNIVVVLGYGYNTDEAVADITNTLNENFGVESEDRAGLISIFTYPKDFMVAGKERISSLADRVEDKNLAGMIILGSPEGLHIALSKIQDRSEEGKISYPVFTLFSQDDVLGSESTSDFVLDFAHKTNTLEGEITDFIPDFDAKQILIKAISQMIELREPLKADQNLQAFVQKLLEKDRKVFHYVDGETGLQSINHFIFE